MAKEYKDLVVGLDIGTSKVMVVVGEVLPGGDLKLAGLGVSPSNGLKRGVVVNIDATVQSIQQALKEAELMADCKISRVYTGITGSHIRGINSSGMVAVKDKEVSQHDVARVIETAKAINISTDQRLLLVEPQPYLEFNYLVKHAKAVITDSGGITEETTVMGVPCLTMRDNTERPETVEVGTNELIGTNPAALKPALDRLFEGKWKKGAVPELWDGRTSERIVAHLEKVLAAG